MVVGGFVMRKRLLWGLMVFLSVSVLAGAQANGKLQIHFIDVGQGDGALLISPQGETVLFDGGVLNKCDKPLSYLQQLGVTKIDYLVVSHYHSDHIGCTPQEFQEFPLQKDSIDRGFNYTTGVYNDYVTAVGQHRVSVTHPGKEIVLDSSSPNPVKIKIVVVDGVPLNAPPIATDNENDLSLAALVSFGRFRAEIGGDLSGVANVRHFGSTTIEYKDIESSVAPDVGPIDVYKVHHHCSAFSSNQTWLSQVTPTVAIVSVGDGNTYGHPAPECVQRLHAAGIQKSYWTEHGAGKVNPEPGLDVVGGNIIVEVPVPPADTVFTVAYNDTQLDTYPVRQAASSSPGPGNNGPPNVPSGPKYAWSKNSKVYHYASCSYVTNISSKNLQTGSNPPRGKTLHQGCPVRHQNPETTDPSDLPQ
jgi:beta-lactamase superfamily II metal-dependent hydrolase